MTNRFSSPNQQFVDNTGTPYAGGTLTFYSSGTSSLLSIYNEPTGQVFDTNPVVLDSAGRAGNIFLQNLPYKVVLADVNGVQIWTADPVYSSDYSTIAQFQVYPGSPNGAVAGTAGSGTIPSSVVWDNVNNILYVATSTGSSATAVWTAVNVNSTSSSLVPAPQGRVTVLSGIPINVTDFSGTDLYYTPFIGTIIPIYNGNAFVSTVFAELHLTLVASHLANTNYDIFVFSDSGVLTIISGPAWTSAVARGAGAGTTELTTIDGFYVNNVQISGRNGANTYTVPANQATYVGTFRTGLTTGTCLDFAQKRFVYNAYNRVPRSMTRVDNTATWTYSTAAFRQANANVGNQLAYLAGLQTEPVECTVSGLAISSTANLRNACVGVGLSSTTVNSATVSIAADITNAAQGATVARYRGLPGLGYNYLVWLEYGGGANTQTWTGTGSLTITGMTGEVYG